MSTLKVAVIQQACTDDYEHNVSNSERLIREAANAGARLVVLQELHCSLYFCQSEDLSPFALAEPIPGPSTQRFGALSKELGIVLVISLFEKCMPGLHYNTAVVLESDGTIAGIYRKMHIPDDPGFYEKFYFTPGDLGFTPIDTSIGKLGVMVCWDQWYPEAARLMALAGAEILIYPTAIGWDPSDDEDEKSRQRDAWQVVQRGHSVANHLPVLTPNRIGHECVSNDTSKGIDFWGHSFITGYQGELLAQADGEKECVIYAELKTHDFDFNRNIWPFFRDRRIDQFSDLQQRSLIKNTLNN